MRRIEVTLEPESTFPVPQSDGYQVYSGLLSALDDVDGEVSDQVHDSPIGSLTASGLRGPFGDADRRYHKTVRAGNTYELTLGVVDPADRAVFQGLVNAFVLEGDGIDLAEGRLRVQSFESANATHEELLDRAAGLDDPTLEVEFVTPTCIEEAGGVTTMFPHRVPVFRSLLGKWNRTAPEDLELSLGREEIAGNVLEKPDTRSLRTHSVLVNRVENGDGETRAIFRQGFSGRCDYEFKDTSESVENAVTALALFGEFGGVGSAVARGCGSVEVAVIEG